MLMYDVDVYQCVMYIVLDFINFFTITINSNPNNPLIP